MIGAFFIGAESQTCFHTCYILKKSYVYCFSTQTVCYGNYCVHWYMGWRLGGAHQATLI